MTSGKSSGQMGGKKEKQKNKQQGQKSAPERTSDIENLDKIGEEDNRSDSSLPSLNQYAGNEFNLYNGANISSSNEDANREAQQKQNVSDKIVSDPDTIRFRRPAIL